MHNGVNYSVCGNAFYSIHGITEKRVRVVLDKQTSAGYIENDKRGQAIATKVGEAEWQILLDHINSILKASSHYSGVHRLHRRYLPTGLNINDDGDLKSQETVYIKSEVPDSELEFVSIKEESTGLHQEPSENSLDAEVPSSPSFNPAPSVPGVLPSAPASASPSAELLNSRCSTATPDAASKSTSKTKELSVHDVIKMAVSQIASLLPMEINKYSSFGEVVANELSKMESIQETIAKKLINDVIYMGVMGSLKPNMHVAE
ncbi:hypothetical protein FHG87_006853 [Trinorchestia longiramus]|nr:hypothetical protein FHG87_006853 [Trinorchestia longiramus]